ncbi:OmpA family protein [Iodobacter fluviatilis]|uniref:Flagellar motor protein MotB n=1 Tax=Iodobacter fluviatilis TaxID=537 RepID=A0A7G3G840_9NEIS|nr:OmpA family protein [Iodobacter fluviatilis]QBC43203.1 flagellar motor protein MotB [Iodobacter fluviatilis]
MNKKIVTPILLAIAVLIAACGTAPTSTGLLDQTRIDYVAIQNDPAVLTYAAVEMKQAGDALNKANAAAINKDSEKEIDNLAYLAKQKIALTQEVAKQKASEAGVVNSAKIRDQARLEQRTKEADQAKVEVQNAKAHVSQLDQQLADLKAKKTERGMVVTLSDVLFGTDLSRLNDVGMQTAKKLADVLQQNPNRTVLVEGFTDSTGAAKHNQGLSERRATAVRNALQELGVADSRIAIHGYGEAHPVASNKTADSRQLNRRVEIILSDDTGRVTPR